MAYGRDETRARESTEEDGEKKKNAERQQQEMECLIPNNLSVGVMC